MGVRWDRDICRTIKLTGAFNGGMMQGRGEKQVSVYTTLMHQVFEMIYHWLCCRLNASSVGWSTADSLSNILQQKPKRSGTLNALYPSGPPEMGTCVLRCCCCRIFFPPSFQRREIPTKLWQKAAAFLAPLSSISFQDPSSVTGKHGEYIWKLLFLNVRVSVMFAPFCTNGKDMTCMRANSMEALRCQLGEVIHVLLSSSTSSSSELLATSQYPCL